MPIVGAVAGYYRYDASAESLLLNKIWLLQSRKISFFLPQQKLVSKIRHESMSGKFTPASLSEP